MSGGLTPGEKITIYFRQICIKIKDQLIFTIIIRLCPNSIL